MGTLHGLKVELLEGVIPRTWVAQGLGAGSPHHTVIQS